MGRKPTKKGLSSIPLEEAHGGSGRRQLIFSQPEEFLSKHFHAMTKGFLPPGASYDWHQHDNIDELFLVMSGVGFIEYADGTKFDYASGDVFYSPAGIAHILTNTGTDDNVFFFVRLDE